jgi:hypothetical protein
VPHGLSELKRITELERKIGQLTMENDLAFLGRLPDFLKPMTRLSRASYYRSVLPTPTQPVEMELRDVIQHIALQFPAGTRVLGGAVGRLFAPSHWLGSGAHAAGGVDPVGLAHGSATAGAGGGAGTSFRPRYSVCL